MLNLDNYLYVPTPMSELTPGDYILHNSTVYVYLGRHAWETGYKMYVMREDDPAEQAHWTKDTWKGNYSFTKLKAM